jgi:hypothetical protein
LFLPVTGKLLTPAKLPSLRVGFYKLFAVLLFMIIAFSGQAFKRIQPHLHHIRTHLSKYIIRSMSAKPTSSLLDCQLDSYKMEGTSRVVSCVQKDATYHVVLEDSVLYPEGGGQPWDFGSVAGMKVEKVVKGPTNKQVLVELPNPLEEGSEVTCSIDWSRRYDFMQQHTAQVRIW